MSSASRLRAPREDGAVVAQPPLEQVGALLEENQERLTPNIPILSRSLADLRPQASRDILQQARAYLYTAGSPLPSWSGSRLIMAGHQPELFHPGVWIKNFALSGLAKKHDLIPLFLIVDNDIAKATVLRMPVHPKDPAAVHLATIPFDRWQEEVPYEERKVADETLFADFPRRAAAVMKDWGWEPLLPAFWGEALRQASRTPLLGERLAAARRHLERRWACDNLEVPVSCLSGIEPFAWFACHLFADAPRFHSLYNEVVGDYRRRHGLRSRHHPVPDLARQGDWLEMPFWAWTTGASRRGRLFVRSHLGALQIRSDSGALAAGDPGSLVNEMLALEQHGHKVRPRALTTTLFARLFLADLFMHGIGGGKYDELTDELIRRFYGLTPPHLLILSGTLLLPFARFPASVESLHDLTRRQRDLWYNPQRHLTAQAADEARELAAQKEAWIRRSCATAAERRQRFQAIREINARLQPQVADQSRELARQVDLCRQQFEANLILGRRDYAFCLYPERLLRPFCEKFLG